MIICKLIGHKWKIGENILLRTCVRCGHEQTVWLNKYPKIGEPQTMWGDSPNQRMMKKRFRIRFWGKWLWRFIPQPHWLRRWYYNKSTQWWGHPSNHHWKGCLLPDIGDGENKILHIPNLLPGERDIWGGGYCPGIKENDGRN